MRPNAEKNRKLLKQYPFLREIMATPLEPNNGDCDCQIHDLTIKVERADGELMYAQAFNVGLGEASSFFNFSGPRRNQSGRRGEYLFALDGDGTIIRRLSWPRNSEEERKRTAEVYGHHVLWGREVSDGHLTDCLTDRIKYLVWVQVDSWHESTKDSLHPFGKFVDRTLRLTLYLEPKEGFEKLMMEASLEEHLYLSNRVLERGAVRNDFEMHAISGRLAELCRQFEDEVYFQGMMAIRQAGEFRGASGQFGPVKVLASEMCGYERVTLEDTQCWITFQLRPGNKHMYVHAMGGTLPNLRNLVKTMASLWRDHLELRDQFKSDKNVSVI